MNDRRLRDLPIVALGSTITAVVLPEYATNQLQAGVFKLTFTAGEMDEYQSRRVATWILRGSAGTTYRNYVDLIEFAEAAPITQALYFVWRLAAEGKPSATASQTYEVFEDCYTQLLLAPPAEGVVASTILRAMEEMTAYDPLGGLSVADLVLSLRWPQATVTRSLNRLQARAILGKERDPDSLERYRIIDFDAAERIAGQSGTSTRILPPETPVPTVGTITRSSSPGYDVFLSHASEDKEDIARPLYEALSRRSVNVWFDEAVLDLGDSLRQKIDEGLLNCRFGVVILSPAFFAKAWPQRELDGLVARETASGEKAILPVWHNVGPKDVLRFSTPLADRVAASSSEGIESVAEKIVRVLSRS